MSHLNITLAISVLSLFPRSFNIVRRILGALMKRLGGVLALNWIGMATRDRIAKEKECRHSPFHKERRSRLNLKLTKMSKKSTPTSEGLAGLFSGMKTLNLPPSVFRIIGCSYISASHVLARRAIASHSASTAVTPSTAMWVVAMSHASSYYFCSLCPRGSAGSLHSWLESSGSCTSSP